MYFCFPLDIKLCTIALCILYKTCVIFYVYTHQMYSWIYVNIWLEVVSRFPTWNILCMDIGTFWKLIIFNTTVIATANVDSKKKKTATNCQISNCKVYMYKAWLCEQLICMTNNTYGSKTLLGFLGKSCMKCLYSIHPISKCMYQKFQKFTSKLGFSSVLQIQILAQTFTSCFWALFFHQALVL